MRFDLPDGEFVIPSGIVASTPDVIAKLAEAADGVGVITTKSIGISERDGNREPIIAGVGGSLLNAVGLSNPGADAFADELNSLAVLSRLRKRGKVLMASIFGGSEDEFVEVALKLASHVDWIELNLSCPHAAGYGAAIGTKPSLVESIVRAVRGAVDLPIFAKIIPAIGLAGTVAKKAVGAGADGITAVNTVGPFEFLSTDGKPLLSNVLGSLSGQAIREIAIRCVAEVRSEVSCPIIGMGGIASKVDVDAFRKAGATLFGIGTALLGMSTEEITGFFKSVMAGRPLVKDPAILHRKWHIKEAWGSEKGRVLAMEEPLAALPGQFVHVWIPGIGEKPFSLASDSPAMLLIKAVGPVSSALCRLEEGSELLIRGPYGNGYSPSGMVSMVGGGTGVAPIHFAAKRFRGNVVDIFVGGKSSEELPLLDELRRYAEVHVATEDGSLGSKCLVSGIMDIEGHGGIEFLNCGPEVMLSCVSEIESRVTDPSKIFCVVERHSKCGVGICGSCSMDGLRICVDGPVFRYSDLRAGRDFGRFKRAASGKLVRIGQSNGGD